jgi:Protein of unknown function (DUF2628)
MENNPYKAPGFTDESQGGVNPTFGASGLYPREAELRAFVGRNAAYYLRNWSPTLEHSLQVGGFNWAAFFLTGIWLAYRKMYRVVFILVGIFVVEGILEEFVVAGGFVKPESVKLVNSFLILISSVVCANFGNGWYLAHATRQIAKIRALGLPDDAHFKALARRGRPSLLGVLGVFALMLVLSFAIGVALELMFAEE